MGLQVQTVASYYSSALLDPSVFSASNIDFRVVATGSAFLTQMMARTSGGISGMGFANSCYFLRIEPSSGNLEIWSVTGGVTTPLGSASVPPITTSSFSLRFVVTDSQMTGYVNGDSQADITVNGSFGSKPSGGIGLMSFNGTEVYDNIQVNSSCGFVPPSSATPSSTMTVTPTFTVAATPIPGTFSGSTVANFEDNALDTINGGGISTIVDGLGSHCGVTIIPGGCSFGTAGYSCHFSGSLVQISGNSPYAQCRMQLVTGGQNVNLNGIALYHSMTFSYLNNSPGTTYRVCLESGAIADYDQYCYSFTPSGTGWQQMTIYFPDVSAAGLPTLAQQGFGVPVSWTSCVSQIYDCRFEAVPSTSGTVPFDLQVDDINFGPPPYGNNPGAVATAMGVPIATVLDTYSLGVDEFMGWIIMRISRHCGCSPHTIYGLRSTMSWGQICASYGTTWDTVVAEADAQAQAAGMTASQGNADQIQRSLDNSPPPAPVSTPAPYIPGGPVVIPNANIGGC